ncbi:hypothetical protein DM02DRAFT_661434 [Periconia macrospinosa]|uniref:Zn(2)-C6 fungal-type domain-containing protein n=1 Tax=Periconia macrospinosa TaxID=97972 RepID=A0A2V1D7C0_9PLEO|nr:hypothetical protein DM02DRAFT_661434 [Periconia macrospinosa]
MSQTHRQQPGLACEDCRRRKARCDRVRPTCGLCMESAITCCYVDKRPPRGPRKGQITALRNLIADLEQRLSERTGAQDLSHRVGELDDAQKQRVTVDSFLALDSDTTMFETTPMTLAMEFHPTGTLPESPACPAPSLSSSIGSASLPNLSLETSPFSSAMSLATDMNAIAAISTHPNDLIMNQTFTGTWFENDTIVTPSTSPTDMSLLDPTFISCMGVPVLSELMKADLDELYFERVHQVSPNIHRQKYFAWAKRKQLTIGQSALQYAMWAVAAAVSAQLQPLSSMLYAEARRRLDKMDNAWSSNDTNTGIEHIQAWLLVAHWELLCNHENQAMMTAGRAIHMVQLARLHDIDSRSSVFSPHSECSVAEQSFVDSEERRRTFWLAFCFDRFCLMHNDCPPCLQEQLLHTRLPAPEANFQNGQPVQTEFLSDALAQASQSNLPPFATCIVLKSLLSQCISHRHLAMSEAASSGNDPRKVWSKYAWLALAVEKRKEASSPRSPIANEVSDDPMAHYTSALAACLATTVYQSMAQSASWSDMENASDVPPYMEQTVQAVQELINFIEATPRSVSRFKMHPFLPAILYRAIMFLVDISQSPGSSACVDSSRAEGIGILVGILRDLEPVNNLSRNVLSKIESNELCAKILGRMHH